MEFNSSLDKTIKIKCIKEKKGNRTYIYGLFNYFENNQLCDEFCNKMKKYLATSMEIKDEEKQDNETKKTINEENSNDETIENENKDETIENENKDETIENKDEIIINQSDNNENKKNKKKKKKNENIKKIVIINKPIYTFRGDLIRKITDYLKENLNNLDLSKIES